MKLTNKQIGLLSILVMIAIGIATIVYNKAVSTKGDYSPVIQTGDNSPVHYQVTISGTEETEKFLKKIKPRKIPPAVSSRSKVVIAGPSVAFTNWKDGSIVYGEVVNGCVTAGFDIKFLNIGEVDAENITTKWTIYDNGRYITGLNEWLTKIGRNPLVTERLKPNNMVSIKYGPHVTVAGKGTLELTLDYEYTDSKTGEKYSGQYKGFVDYGTEKNNKPKTYLVSPLPFNPNK